MPTGAIPRLGEWRKFASAIALFLGLLAFPAFAGAADSVYWTNYFGAARISYAALDGSGGGNLPLPGLSALSAAGIALDPAANRVYWTSPENDAIYYAALDGSGGAKLNITGVTVDSPSGIAIDKATGRIYWSSQNSISFANLVGGGGGKLPTPGAIPKGPYGLAIDSERRMIFWANFEIGPEHFSYAKLDGTGAGDVFPAGVNEGGNMTGIAIDPASSRVFWGNLSSGIFSSGLDGSGAAPLNTAGALATTVRHLAIDTGSGRVFWVNEKPVPNISFAALNGSGGGNLPVTGATLESPSGIAILRSPHLLAAPVAGRVGSASSPLSCSPGAWAGDLPSAQLYRAVRSIAYQWQRDGADVPGATAEILRPAKPGSYACRVTASNHAGSTVSASNAVRVKRGLVRGPKVAKVKRGRALLRLRCGGDPCDGAVKLSARLENRRVQVGQARFSIPPGRSKVIRVRLNRKGKRLLAEDRDGRFRVRLAGSGVKGMRLTLKRVSP